MYYFIVNPLASSSKGLRIWQTLEKELIAGNVSYQMFYTSKQGHATLLAKTISAKYAPCTIIAVGGDGTANEVICGLTNLSDITFGYIPTGSGNDFSRGLGLSANPSAALNAILNPTVRKQLSIGCTVIKNREHRFIVSSGYGFDAAVCTEALTSPIKKFLNQLGLGKMTYLGIALKKLYLLKPAPMTLILDERRRFEFDGIFFIACMNLKYEGGGFMFAPDADGSDEYLDLCVIEKMSKLRILRLLPTAFTGKHVNYDGVYIYRCKTAAFQSSIPLQVHTDGENAGVSSKLSVRLETDKLNMIIS